MSTILSNSTSPSADGQSGTWSLVFVPEKEDWLWPGSEAAKSTAGEFNKVRALKKSPRVGSWGLIIFWRNVWILSKRIFSAFCSLRSVSVLFLTLTDLCQPRAQGCQGEWQWTVPSRENGSSTPSNAVFSLLRSSALLNRLR